MSADELRAARRARVFDAMDAAGLDALVLSRRDNVAYATGTRSLWTAGTRPFGAACVLVGTTATTHLLSTWDEGVPPEVPFEHLYGVTWNPAVMARSLAAVPGLGEARRIGVDGLSVGFTRAAGRLAPRAELVPADDLLATVRSTKLPAELDRIRTATALAALGVDTASGALADGASPPEARAAAVRAVAARGVTVPSSAPVVLPVADGSLVHVDMGWIVDEYEGGRGRTLPVGGDAVTGTRKAKLGGAAAVHRRLLAASRPGATGVDLRATAAAAGIDDWMVRGSGMGFEPPVLTPTLGSSVELAEGMVVSVAVDVHGIHRRDLAVVTPAGADPLLPS